MLGGTCGALAGLATVATTRQASPSASVSLLFAALTAVALSGMPLTGGRGSFPRVLVGTLIIATINSALVIRGIQPYWTTIITGVLLIAALAFEKVMTSAVTARLTEGARPVDPRARRREGRRMSGVPALELIGIEKHYGFLKALDDVDFHVR